ncbi:hypothetical protein M2146_002442 [Lachnospiraceae bacterium PF1-22]|uniref:hypothetical protein n=1 Tax=Ohessyouella blattaphilus TaxID=2949333 RepID=UPI003E2581F0
MSVKKLSTLGFIMHCLDIQTVSLSRILHVDASLVSKWKSGDRRLNKNSNYFDPVISFLMEESKKTNHVLLSKALHEVYPLETFDREATLELFVRKLLSVREVPVSLESDLTLGGIKCTTQIASFENNSGRKEAVLTLLNYAESMPS